MSLKFNIYGMHDQLSQVVAYYNGLPVHLHLYQNNITPDESTTLGTLSEADFDGYASQSVNDFGVPVDFSNHVDSTAGTYTFTKGVGVTTNNVYGYYVTDNTDTELLWAERYAGAPAAILLPGQTFSVTPVITVMNQ